MSFKMKTMFNKFEKEIHDMCENNKVDYERIDYLLKNGASANAVEVTEYDNGETETVRYNEISFKSNSIKNSNKDVIGYFREITKYLKNDNKNDNESEDSFLKTEYQNINYINSESVLHYYINKKALKTNNESI